MAGEGAPEAVLTADALGRAYDTPVWVGVSDATGGRLVLPLPRSARRLPSPRGAC